MSPPCSCSFCLLLTEETVEKGSGVSLGVKERGGVASVFVLCNALLSGGQFEECCGEILDLGAW